MKHRFNPAPTLIRLWQRYAASAFLCMVTCIAWSIYDFIPYDNTAAAQPFRDALDAVYTAALLGLVPATAFLFVINFAQSTYDLFIF